MPGRNVIKTYVDEGAYHVYNRGVEKRDIFLDEKDYVVLLHFLKLYLSHPSPESNPDDAQSRWQRLRLERVDIYKRVRLLAYCLMPNHFHLMLRQQDKKAMADFVRRLSNAYVAYFNERYKRVGALFQGCYKAVLVNDDAQLVKLSRYVHRNPLDLLPRLNLTNLAHYPYSSYPCYLGMRQTNWLRAQEILRGFEEPSGPGAAHNYRAYVEDMGPDDFDGPGSAGIDS
jgi:putative transposase